MKLPIIGLTMDHSPASDARTFAKGVDIYYLNDVYVRYAEKARCLCICLPTTGKENVPGDLVFMLDGLMLTGGNDVYSGVYGEEPLSDQWQHDAPRTFFEKELIRQALSQNKPIFGICRGFQMLNAALGGSLYQDLPSQVSDAQQHRSPDKPAWNYHSVQVKEHSLLHRVIGQNTFQVSTSHHQAIKKLAEPLTAVAWAADGIIEAVEYPGQKFVLGVQWHPEVMADDPTALALLYEFVKACTQ